MKLVRAIPFGDVKPGYRVSGGDGRFYAVERIENGPEGAPPPPFLILWLDNGLMIPGHRDALVEVGFLPWPDGKTAYDMLDTVDRAILAYRLGLDKPEDGRRAILEALEVYELGKPHATEEKSFCGQHDCDRTLDL